jgi:dihydrofolate reductase
MRKLVVSTIMSLDGYVEGRGGNVMALPMDGFFDAHNLQRLRSADTLLLGRNTYLGLKDFWSAVADDPAVSFVVAADPAVAELHRETGQRNNQMRKVVVSNSLTPDDTAPWTDTTTIMPRADAHAAITALKAEPGRDILVFGSRTLWNDLLAADLVDELYLMVGATVLGGGTPAFQAAAPALELLETQRHDGSDNVLLHYRVTAPAGPSID